MTAQTTAVFVKDGSTTNLTEQYTADPSGTIADAVKRNLNIVVSKKPGMGIVTSTLEQLREVTPYIQLVDMYRFFGVTPFGPNLNQEVEVVVFDELHPAFAGDGMINTATELMSTRSLNGTKYPNLKSVVVFLDQNDKDAVASAAGFSDLAPSLSIEWS